MAGAGNPVTGTIGAVTDTVGKLQGALDNDPKQLMGILINEYARRTGKSVAEVQKMLNSQQGVTAIAEEMAKYFGGQLGADHVKNFQNLFYSVLTADKDVAQRKAEEAARGFAAMLQDLNRTTLDTEKLKLAENVGFYSFSGKVAGFMYAVGAFIESISPGSGRTLMDNAKNVMDEVGENIRGIQIHPQNQQAFADGYKAQLQTMLNMSLFQSAGMNQRFGTQAGLAVSGQGTPAILQQSVPTAQGAADPNNTNGVVRITPQAPAGGTPPAVDPAASGVLTAPRSRAPAAPAAQQAAPATAGQGGDMSAVGRFFEDNLAAPLRNGWNRLFSNTPPSGPSPSPQ